FEVFSKISENDFRRISGARRSQKQRSKTLNNVTQPPRKRAAAAAKAFRALPGTSFLLTHRPHFIILSTVNRFYWRQK
ncbi:MAG: hypothetical protein J6X47_02695, partial [Clostridia bacterium]|nr:hypothetical protein [Clostridia bacterium]